MLPVRRAFCRNLRISEVQIHWPHRLKVDFSNIFKLFSKLCSAVPGEVGERWTNSPDKISPGPRNSGRPATTSTMNPLALPTPPVLKRSFRETAAFSLAEVTLAIGVAGFRLLTISGLLSASVTVNRVANEQTIDN